MQGCAAVRLCFGILSSLSLGIPGWGEQSWDALLRESLRLQMLGRFDQAAELCDQADRLLRGNGSPVEAVESLHVRRGLILIDQGRYAEAESFLHEVWQSRRERLGLHHPHTLDAQHYLSQTYMMTGRPHQALDLVGPVVRAFERDLGPDDPRAVVARWSLALALREAREYDKAAHIMEDLIHRVKAAGLTDTMHFVRMLGDFAVAKIYQGKLKDARRLIAEAVAIAARREPHPSHIHLLITQSQLELIRKKPDPALLSIARAADMAREFWPEGHPERATLYATFGMAYSLNKDFPRAENYLRKAVAIYEKSLDPNHPEIGAVLAHLATVLRKTDHSEEATQVETRSRAILTRTPIPEAVSVWSLRPVR